MNEIVSTAEAIKELGVVGLLAVAVIVEGLVIRHLYTQFVSCMKGKAKT